MANVTKELSGRSWDYTDVGFAATTRKFAIVQDSVAGNVPTLTGIPAVGDAHPSDERVKVTKVSVSERSAPDERQVLDITVDYERVKKEDVKDEETSEVLYECDEWGWDSTTADRDFIEDINGAKVVNSAGDPFDSVPRVSVFAPTFTKVIKSKSRKSDALGFNCKVNNAQVTIGNMTCAARTLLASVSEKRIFGDANWNYSYTIQLRYCSNMVKILNSSTKTEIGWDVAVGDTGMYERDAQGKRQIIRQIDKETQKECEVSSPAKLDGMGHAVSPTDENQDVRFREFWAYERANFAAWLYEEPSLPQPQNNTNGGGAS